METKAFERSSSKSRKLLFLKLRQKSGYFDGVTRFFGITFEMQICRISVPKKGFTVANGTTRIVIEGFSCFWANVNWRWQSQQRYFCCPKMSFPYLWIALEKQRGQRIVVFWKVIFIAIHNNSSFLRREIVSLYLLYYKMELLSASY